MNKSNSFNLKIGSAFTVAAVFAAIFLFVVCDNSSTSPSTPSGGSPLVLGSGEAWVDDITGITGFIFRGDGKVQNIISAGGTNWMVASTENYTVNGNNLTMTVALQATGITYTYRVTSTTLTLTVAGGPEGVPGMTYTRKSGITIPGSGPCDGLTSALPGSACCVEQPSFNGCFAGGAGGLLLPLGEAWIEQSMGVTGFVFRDNGMVWVITSMDGINWMAATPVNYTQSGNTVTIAPTTYTFNVAGETLTFSVAGSSITQTYEKRSGLLIDGIPPYVLTIDIIPAGSGTVNRSPMSGGYAAGTVVTMEAVPTGSYIFVGWSGAVTGTTATREITMSGHRTVTANFRQLTASDYNYGSYCDFGPIVGDRGGCIQIVQGTWQGLPCTMQGGTVRANINGCSAGSLRMICDYGFGNCEEVSSTSQCTRDGVLVDECGGGGTYCNYGQPDAFGAGGCFFETFSVPSGGYSFIPPEGSTLRGRCSDREPLGWAAVVTQQACITSNTQNPCISDPLKPGEWGGTGHVSCPAPPVPQASLVCAPGEAWLFSNGISGYVLLAGGVARRIDRISGQWNVTGTGTWQESSGLISIDVDSRVFGTFSISGNNMTIQAVGGSTVVYQFTKTTGINPI
jgi:uncharacterized repeat protein (TIGR02543 family)